MADILLSPTNFWFSVALIAVFFVFILELISVFFGVSMLGLNDDIGDIDSNGFLSSAFANFLNLNKVPFLIWLVIFLTLFGLAGLIINGLTPVQLPQLLSITLAITIGILITRKCAVFIAALLPSSETSAINNDDFIGAVAEITIGRASRGNPAEAKFTDSFSQPHFVLVEPFEKEELFAQGERVILVQKSEYSWLATRYQ
tara:strand:+ start:2381 stop:2983 length:603 start_codon:yes stop_codon:yes gene_type:complete